jgi:toxin ParE1/3/4
MKVVLSWHARVDLLEIADYIAKDNPRRARTFAAELMEKALAIGRTPFGFQLMPGHEAEGVRRWPFGAYVIFYTVQEDAVAVARILHGAQDAESILFPDA